MLYLWAISFLSLLLFYQLFLGMDIHDTYTGKMHLKYRTYICIPNLTVDLDQVRASRNKP